MCISHLGFYHPELGQVATRLRFLRAEGWPKTISLSQSGSGGFVIELPRLREIRLLAVEIVHFKKRSGTFARCGRKDWRVGKCEAIVIQEVAHGLNYRVANFQNCMLPARP